MNPDTRIAVHCYAGDAHQVASTLDMYLHHECPVSVFSPADAPATLPDPITNSHAGARTQNGPQASERHLQYLKLLLTFPESRFLMHESDSVCLDPRIPDYLYAEPDIFWGNCTIDPFGYWTPQAPWFFSRRVAERLIAVADAVTYDPKMAWVDHYLIKLCDAAGIECRKFLTGCCVPMAGQIIDDPTHAEGLRIGLDHARRGFNLMHSVKNPVAMRELAEAYRTRS